MLLKKIKNKSKKIKNKSKKIKNKSKSKRLYIYKLIKTKKGGAGLHSGVKIINDSPDFDFDFKKTEHSSYNGVMIDGITKADYYTLYPNYKKAIIFVPPVIEYEAYCATVENAKTLLISDKSYEFFNHLKSLIKLNQKKNKTKLSEYNTNLEKQYESQGRPNTTILRTITIMLNRLNKIHKINIKHIINFELYYIIYKTFDIDIDDISKSEIFTICYQNFDSQAKKSIDKPMRTHISKQNHKDFETARLDIKLLIKTYIYIISSFYTIKNNVDHLKLAIFDRHKSITVTQQPTILLIDVLNLYETIIDVYKEKFISLYNTKYNGMNYTHGVNVKLIESTVKLFMPTIYEIIDKLNSTFINSNNNTILFFFTKAEPKEEHDKILKQKDGKLDADAYDIKPASIASFNNTNPRNKIIWSNSIYKESNELDDYSLLITYFYMKSIFSTIKIISNDKFDFLKPNMSTYVNEDTISLDTFINNNTYLIQYNILNIGSLFFNEIFFNKIKQGVNSVLPKRPKFEITDKFNTIKIMCKTNNTLKVDLTKAKTDNETIKAHQISFKDEEELQILKTKNDNINRLKDKMVEVGILKNSTEYYNTKLAKANKIQTKKEKKTFENAINNLAWNNDDPRAPLNEKLSKSLKKIDLLTKFISLMTPSPITQ